MKFVKLTDTAILPTRATSDSAGYDFYTDEEYRLMPGECKVIRTGITFEGMPKNGYLQLSLRSGTSIKRPFLMANGIGIIDSDYSGNEIGIILFNRGNIPALVEKGEKMAQGILLKYHTIKNEEKVTTKRTGGYGSTGK